MSVKVTLYVQRVPASGWTVEEIEERCPRRLHLERDVRMPGDGVGAFLEEVVCRRIVCASVDQMDLWEALQESNKY